MENVGSFYLSALPIRESVRHLVLPISWDNKKYFESDYITDTIVYQMLFESAYQDLTDDRGAKRYVSNKLSSRQHEIDVYNVYDVLAKIGQNDSNSIEWRNVKGMVKQAMYNKNYERRKNYGICQSAEIFNCLKKNGRF